MHRTSRIPLRGGSGSSSDVALPSAVTLGSLAFVVAAGAGYVAISTASADSAAAPPDHHVSGPVVAAPSKPISRPEHSSPPHQAKADAVPHVLVVVFNNTGISGLAAKKAAGGGPRRGARSLPGGNKIASPGAAPSPSKGQFAGWHVAATDNWYGNIPADTVYYPPALRTDAVKLAKVLHIARLRPAVAPMQFDRLTVIIATS